jgi:serine/threonine protein kinase
MKCSKCQHENPPGSQYCSKCGTQIVSSSEPHLDSTVMIRPQIFDLPIGSIFAKRYQIIEELGRGGMGTVYKVLDKEVNEKIALKVLKPEISFDLKTIDRFRNELKIARKISQPNVCRMYDLMKESGTYFITMEYVSGEDLKSTILRLGQISMGKALIIAKQICAGLAAAHQLGIVHRDLKPHNIMIDRAGNVRIMDFGIAWSAKSRGLTESGAIIGTPEYMSPEQALGDEVDIRSDIYSLGVVLFELVTGKVPFEGTTAVGVAMKQKTELPPEPMSINDQISDEFNHLILKCLEKDPKRRYQSADEVLDEIVRIERGFPTTDSIRPEKRTSKVIPGKRMPKFLMPGAVVLAALILVGGLIILKPWKDGPGVRDEGKGEEQKVLPVKDDEKKKEDEDLSVQSGFFEIASEPEGADVYLDDKLLGKTPLKHEAASGSHKLRLAYNGYKMTIADLAIEPGKTFVETYVLEPSYILMIKTVPTGARVKMDGKYVGTTGTDALEVESPGDTCRLSFEKSGWETMNLSLTLKPGENPVSRNLVRVKAKPKPKPKPKADEDEKKKEEQAVLAKVMLVIDTAPSSARISLNDKLVGTTPLKASYPPGKYQIKIEKAGYQTREFAVDLQTNFERTYNLEKLESLQLLIKVHPWADVFIDGKFAGQIPPVKRVPIDVGKHTLKFKRDGQFIDKEIEIKRGKNLEVFMNLLTGEFKVQELEPDK